MGLVTASQSDALLPGRLCLGVVSGDRSSSFEPGLGDRWPEWGESRRAKESARIEAAFAVVRRVAALPKNAVHDVRVGAFCRWPGTMSGTVSGFLIKLDAMPAHPVATCRALVDAGFAAAFVVEHERMTAAVSDLDAGAVDLTDTHRGCRWSDVVEFAAAGRWSTNL